MAGYFGTIAATTLANLLGVEMYGVVLLVCAMPAKPATAWLIVTIMAQTSR
jgi:hypothetical protein